MRRRLRISGPTRGPVQQRPGDSGRSLAAGCLLSRVSSSFTSSSGAFAATRAFADSAAASWSSVSS